MRTLEQSLKNQKNATVFWWIFLLVSLLLLCSPAAADILFSFEATMAFAFIGLVFGIISIAMIRVFRTRKRLVSSLMEQGALLDSWICADRYQEHKGADIPALFSKNGVFYAGNPYCMKSYDCVIKGAEVIDDEGPALSIEYTVPNSRNGAFRHKQVINIPIPGDKMESAVSLAAFYSEAGSKNSSKSKQ